MPCCRRVLKQILYLTINSECLKFVSVVEVINIRTYSRKTNKLRVYTIYPHFTKDYFGPDSTRSIFSVDRPHICETIGNLRAITGNHPRRSGKVWRNRISPTRVGYRKIDRLLFLNMFKNSSRSKPVGR